MTSVELRWTTQLTPGDYGDMAALFDSEYGPTWGPWNARYGYGYARGELHALARAGGELVGYAATARRFIGVGDHELVVSGVGGVMTKQALRSQGIGRLVIGALQEAMRTDAPSDFGLLGCRPDVVPFYRSCGFELIDTICRDVRPGDGMTVVESAGPTLVCAGTRPVGQWPAGTVDLRGLPW